MLVRPRRVPAGILFVALFRIVTGLPMVVRSRLMMGGRFVVCQSPKSADLRHVPAIPAYGLAPFAARFRVALRVPEPTAAIVVILVAASLRPVIVLVPAALGSSPTALGVCHCLSFRT